MTKILDGRIALLILIFKTYLQNGISLTMRLNIPESIGQFKNKLLFTMRPAGNSIYNVHNIIGVRCSTKLRLQFSALNEHKFIHNFDCLSPVCIRGAAKQDNEHFLLYCPSYDIMRCDLLGQLSALPGLGISNYDSKSLCTLLLCRSPLLNVIANRIIMEATISLINPISPGTFEAVNTWGGGG